MEAETEKLKRLVQAIVREANPLKIILFGSAARGDAGPDGDLDILVVMPDGTKRRPVARHLYGAVRNIGVPLDILVATPAILREHKNNIGLIYKTILEEGREIYAA